MPLKNIRKEQQRQGEKQTDETLKSENISALSTLPKD